MTIVSHVAVKFVDLRAKMGPLRRGSEREYWNDRYRHGGTSGDGSYGRVAAHKAEVLNNLVESSGAERVVEFGCGDGAQLELANYPEYVGIDLAPEAVRLAAARHRGDPRKSFLCVDPESISDGLGLLSGDVAISLDVVYHLLTERAVRTHLSLLFGTASKLVVIYSSDSEEMYPGVPSRAHIAHWPVQRMVEEWHGGEWQLREKVANPYPFDIEDGSSTSIANFYIYHRKTKSNRRCECAKGSIR